MSVKEATKSLLKALHAFPKEKLTDLSFKDVQIDRFRPVAGLKSIEKTETKSISEIVNKINPYKIKDIEVQSDENFSESTIIQQIKSLNTLASNQYRDYYFVTDKLLKPQGNPNYYERLLADINGESKENIVTGLRTVIMGK